MRLDSPEGIQKFEYLERLRADKDEGTRMLSTIQRQEVHVHEMHLHHSACWLCGVKCSQYAATGMLDWERPSTRDTFTCPKCGIRLHHFVPFQAFTAPWYWTRPDDMTPEEIVTAATRMQAPS